MKKVLGLLLCATMLLGLMAGCTSSNGGNTTNNTSGNNTTTNNSTTTDDGGDTASAGTVAYLTPSLDVPFWRYVRHGIEDELSKNGLECVTYDSKDDANTQLSNAQDAITKQVDAIIISPTDSASCVSVLSAAEQAGVPVVICDIGTDSGEYVSFISTDNEAGAKAIGEYVASLLEPGTQVAQITLNQARINGVLRKEGFDAGIATNNLEDVDFRQMEKVNRSEGETYAQDLITAYPELGAIFCHSEDPTMGAVSALEAAGRTDVLVVGFDCSPEVVEAIQDGRVAGTSAQQSVVMGRSDAQAVVDYLAGNEVEKEIVLDTLLVTKDNIDELYDTLIEVALTEE